MRLGVVTETPDPMAAAEPGSYERDIAEGNLAAPVSLLYVRIPGKPLERLETWHAVPPGFALALRYEVFTKGELLLLGDDGREVSGRGRNPGKWGVTVKTFPLSDGAEALRLAVELLQELAE